MFVPTYLYIKQHTVTGKLYFGKTTKEPFNYAGSGKHWKQHIRKHGKEHVVTLWHQLIADSSSWLNLVIENGLDGGYGHSGKKHSDDTKAKISLTTKGMINVKDSATGAMVGRVPLNHEKILSGEWIFFHKGIKASEFRRKAAAKQMAGEGNHQYGRRGALSPNFGKPRAVETCPHCGKTGGNGGMARWHFDNCKLKEKHDG